MSTERYICPYCGSTFPDAETASVHMNRRWRQLTDTHLGLRWIPGMAGEPYQPHGEACGEKP